MINLPTRKTQTRAWLLAGLVAVLLRGLPDLRYPVGVDQALFCLIGQGLLRGQQLYRDLWDIKPPGIFYIYALIVKAFGPVAWCIGVVDVFWLLAISLCIFYFARRFVGAPAAALAMVFNVVRHCRQGYIHAAQPETFLMLCVFAAWFLLIPAGPGLVPALADASVGPTSLDGAGARRVTGWPFRSWAWADYLRVVVAGFALGAAFWLKYNAVLFFPVLMLVPFLDFREWDRGSSRVKMVVSWKDWLARVWFVGAGFALTVLAVLAYFWASGAWPAMRESQLEVLPRFAAGHFQWRLTQENLSFLVSALRSSQFHLGLWTEIMAPLSLLIAWGRRELRFLAPVFLLALAGYLCAAVQGQFNSYYFETCHPFFSMFWGYLCVKTLEGFQYARRVFGQRGWMLARAMLWLVLASLTFALFSEEGVRVVQQYGFLRDWWRNPEQSYSAYWYQIPLEKLSEKHRIINYLKKNSDPEDEVYVWGYATLINFLAQRGTPSRFLYDWPVMSTWGLPHWCQELVHVLETKRPRYIVVERNDSAPGCTHTTLDSEQYLRLRQCPALTDLLNRQYQPAVNYTDFEIYMLKKSPGYGAGEAVTSDR
ncbi:MAG: hypothetical protein ABSE93_00355 [Terriglobia bacterium]